MAGMRPINIEVLMGHSTGISDSYYRATENELLDDYLKAVDFLTIDYRHTIAKQLSDLEKKKNFDLAQTNLSYRKNAGNWLNYITLNIRRTTLFAALSDKLQNLMEEVENLKKRR